MKAAKWLEYLPMLKRFERMKGIPLVWIVSGFSSSSINAGYSLSDLINHPYSKEGERRNLFVKQEVFGI